MMPIVAAAPLPLFFPCAAVIRLPRNCFRSRRSIQSAALQNIVHRGTRILFSFRHFLCHLRQPPFPASSPQRPLQQARLKQFHHPLLPAPPTLPPPLPPTFTL